eukprot:SAG25_NODE_390_length_8662_cov_4.211141_10_plen_99_part_00
MYTIHERVRSLTKLTFATPKSLSVCLVLSSDTVVLQSYTKWILRKLQLLGQSAVHRSLKRQKDLTMRENPRLTAWLAPTASAPRAGGDTGVVPSPAAT